ncbi:hypothetical protein [Chitinophaga sp. sic0106]|uniref:hypothetical protein n=1 Tax=Chitinophaga sp. sic0106 TaxID=2854785 RepID=UPI001C43A2D1|nr:hypothetical protein [Chitinophaga sp. sic0106]MBV7531752.1 hypothetical protein [Chitinophaga sp. sic0106]
MDVKFEGKLLDSLTDKISKTAILKAGIPGKLAFYKAGTDSLIIDTLVNVLPNSTINLNVLAVPSLGNSTFIDMKPAVKDTLAFMIYLNLSAAYKYDAVDLQLQYLKRPSNVITDIATIKNVKNKAFLSEILILPQKLNTGSVSTQYWLTLIDPATGNPITIPNANNRFVLSNISTFGNFIANLYDNTDGTMVTQTTKLQ